MSSSFVVVRFPVKPSAENTKNILNQTEGFIFVLVLGLEQPPPVATKIKPPMY